MYTDIQVNIYIYKFDVNKIYFPWKYNKIHMPIHIVLNLLLD